VHTTLKNQKPSRLKVHTTLKYQKPSRLKVHTTEIITELKQNFTTYIIYFLSTSNKISTCVGCQQNTKALLVGRLQLNLWLNTETATKKLNLQLNTLVPVIRTKRTRALAVKHPHVFHLVVLKLSCRLSVLKDVLSINKFLNSRDFSILVNWWISHSRPF
jgi:hypothetical protein